MNNPRDYYNDGSDSDRKYLQIPTDVGAALIPLGLESDDFERLLTALNLYKSKIVSPIALPATSLPPDPTPATQDKKKRVKAKKKSTAPLPIAPTAPETPTSSTKGRKIEDDGYLMDRTPG